MQQYTYETPIHLQSPVYSWLSTHYFWIVSVVVPRILDV